MKTDIAILTRLSCLLLLAIAAGFAFPETSLAQMSDAFIITGSDPSDGAVSVPTNSQVTFTFSDPIDATVSYTGGLPVGLLDPDGSIHARITGYNISSDLLSLTIDITNPEESDLALVVTGATRADGQRLCTPFAFNYTTKATLGSTSVSGAILWGVFKRDGCVFPLKVTATLFDAPIDQGGKFLYAGVSELGTYVITHIRPGTYWPYYFWDYNENGEIEPGFYPNQQRGDEISSYNTDYDGLPDSISTETGDLSGIDAELFLGPASVEDALHPLRVSLEAAYPNPFNPTTTIHYTLARPTLVRLEVFDLLGTSVRVLEGGFRASGEKAVSFDATGLPSGVYFYTLTVGGFTKTRKMMVLK